MAKDIVIMESTTGPKKRKRNNPKMKKKLKKVSHFPQGIGDLKPKKIDRKMKKLFRKRARDYKSDEEESEDKREENELTGGGGDSSEEAEEDDNHEVNKHNDFSDKDEDGEIQPGITKFTEGCRAFRIAFKSIIKKAVHDDALGPVLSAHKKLVAEKLAEEEAERKVQHQAKKEKRLLGEKGHVKPETYLDSHEKFLIGIATKGVVKLFNAVNRAQHAQKGLNPSRFKDEKGFVRKRIEPCF